MSGKDLRAWATRTGCSADDIDVLREGKYDGEKMASSNLRELQQAGVSLDGATRLMDGVEARTGAQQLAVAASPAPDFHCARPPHPQGLLVAHSLLPTPPTHNLPHLTKLLAPAAALSLSYWRTSEANIVEEESIVIRSEAQFSGWAGGGPNKL